MTKCISCNHHHFDSDGVCTNKTCSCTPELFIPVDPSNKTFIGLVYRNQILANLKDISQRIEWLLKAVPETRNMGDWQFIQTCWYYFLGFQFGDTWTMEWYEKINKECQPETIRRARQKICHPELEQLRIFQKRLHELEKLGLDGSTQYWNLTEEIKKFWQTSKYIPNNFDLLRSKRIKESAIFEFSIEELMIS